MPVSTPRARELDWVMRPNWTSAGTLLLHRNRPAVIAPPGVALHEGFNDPAVAAWRLAEWVDADAVLLALPPQRVTATRLDVVSRQVGGAELWLEFTTRRYISYQEVLCAQIGDERDADGRLESLRAQLEDAFPADELITRMRLGLCAAVEAFADGRPSRTISSPGPRPVSASRHEIVTAIEHAPDRKVESVFLHGGTISLDGWVPSAKASDVLGRLFASGRSLDPDRVVEQLSGAVADDPVVLV